MTTEQNYSNHTRFHAPFHFVLVPALLICLIYNVVRAFQDPNWDRYIFVFFNFAVMFGTFFIRLNSLKVQDRVIRLEEFLRYERVLSPELCGKAKQLPVNKIVALRFASDGELSDLIQRVINGEFAKNSEIKRAIKSWRADHHRV